jgi:hypothetical protein
MITNAHPVFIGRVSRTLQKESRPSAEPPIDINGKGVGSIRSHTYVGSPELCYKSFATPASFLKMRLDIKQFLQAR